MEVTYIRYADRTYRNIEGLGEHFCVHLPLSHPEVFGRNILVASFGKATAAHRRARPPVGCFAFHYHKLNGFHRKYLIITLSNVQLGKFTICYTKSNVISR